MLKKLKIISVTTLVIPLLYSPSFAMDSQLGGSLEAISNVSLDATYHPLEGNLPGETTEGNSENIFLLDSGELKIEVPKDSDSPVSIEDSNSKTLITMPTEEGASDAQVVADSVAGFEGINYDSYASLKETGDIQFSTAIKNINAPSEYEYNFVLSEGEKFSKVDKYIVVLDSKGEISAVIDEPWAKDAAGKTVPTFFDIRDNKLVQHVDHKSGEYAYPIIADPVYSRGIISQVVTEQWTAETHWHVAIKVTLKARALWGVGQMDKVYRDGLADLREHHPRSMSSESMAQQWECHVVGLPATRTIDLESIRPSNPQWRDRIPTIQQIVREGKQPIYDTCNW